jgi:SAM-dependent methyltransferase
MQVCTLCGAIGKPTTERLLGEIGEIYGAYDVYYQGGGLEQIVFDGRSGEGIRRSELLARRLRETGTLPAAARAVDLGCGNGAFLRALSGAFPGWSLFGLELDDRSLPAMRDIPGFAGLMTGDAKDLAGRYDLISMIHALEHFLDPFETLQGLRDKLSPGGHLFIEIPNVAENAFDLLIADHISHLTPRTLGRLLARAGFEVVRLETDWVRKEMSVLARAAEPRILDERDPPTLAEGQIAWLHRTLERCLEASRRPPFGLFGTSIAATWLTSAAGDRISFYVDEDPGRQGRSFMGKPVLAPNEVPAGATVFVGLAPAIADVIAARLAALGLNVVGPQDGPAPGPTPPGEQA